MDLQIGITPITSRTAPSILTEFSIVEKKLNSVLMVKLCTNIPIIYLFVMQLSSCFLVCMKDDSIEGIYDTFSECSSIIKSMSLHNIWSTTVTFEELMELSPACVFSVILHAVLIKVEEREKVSSISSLDPIYIFLIVLSFRCICYIFGASTCWYLWVPWFEKEPSEGKHSRSNT